jgi:hypothetical protein
MAKKRSRNNPVFGELAHVAGDLWSRPTELRIFGTVWPVLLRVYLTREGTAPECQARAYADYVARSGDLMGEAEDAIFAYYLSICSEYRGRLGIVDPNDEKVPVITSKKELPRFVTPREVLFPDRGPDPVFGLLCDCTWEEEHGLAVKFVNGAVATLGFQDIVL